MEFLHSTDFPLTVVTDVSQRAGFGVVVVDVDVDVIDRALRSMS
jgi:hypothetical protein